MRTSEVAAQARVNIQSVRYYESRGLLAERRAVPLRLPRLHARRGAGGRFVKSAQQLGFTLDDIKDLLHLSDGGPDSCDEARTMACSDR